MLLLHIIPRRHPLPRRALTPRPQWKFFAAFLAIPAIYFVVQDARSGTPDNPPRLTRLITHWMDQRAAEDQARNLRFMALIEQAAFDRALFQHADKRQNIESRMPEYAPMAPYGDACRGNGVGRNR